MGIFVASKEPEPHSLHLPKSSILMPLGIFWGVLRFTSFSAYWILAQHGMLVASCCIHSFVGTALLQPFFELELWSSLTPLTVQLQPQQTDGFDLRQGRWRARKHTRRELVRNRSSTRFLGLKKWSPTIPLTYPNLPMAISFMSRVNPCKSIYFVRAALSISFHAPDPNLIAVFSDQKELRDLCEGVGPRGT